MHIIRKDDNPSDFLPTTAPSVRDLTWRPSSGHPAILDTLSARNLIEAMPDAIVVVDGAGAVAHLNFSARRLLGITLPEAQRRNIRDFLPLLDGVTRKPVSDPLAHLLAQAETAAIVDRYDLLQRPSGAPLPVECSIGRFPVGDGASGFVLQLRDVSRSRARIEQLTHAARHDEHTHLLRRGEIERRLRRVLEGMRDGDEHALLFMDLDHFKAINDQAGHAAGDLALREVAELFLAQVRERDTLARLGGDEFGLLLEHCPLTLASERAMAIQKAIAGHAFEYGGRRFELGVSIGIAAINGREHEMQAVIASADAACYAAKRHNHGETNIGVVILD